MKKGLLGLFLLFIVVVAPGMGHAWFLNFENGTDAANVVGIPGISFMSFNGYPAIYGDSSTGNYNTHSDDLNYGVGGYHHNGDFFVWAGTNATAQGTIVDFTNNDGTFFRTGYSVNTTNFVVTAFFDDMTSASITGAQNYGAPMSYLQINAPAGRTIDYVTLHDSGNYWLVDDMSGDATGIPGVPEPSTLLLLGMGLIGLAAKKAKK